MSAAILATYTGSSDSTLLAQLSAGCIAWLERWIPRYLGTSATLTEVLDGPRGAQRRITDGDSGERLHTMWLQEEIALGSLVSVKYRTALGNSWADLSTDSAGDADLTDYEIRPAQPQGTVGRKLVRLSGPFPAGTGNLQIKYTHGYAENAGPADVTLAVLQIVKGWVDAKAAGIKKSQRVEGVAWTLADVASLPGVDSQLLLSLKAGRSF